LPNSTTHLDENFATWKISFFFFFLLSYPKPVPRVDRRIVLPAYHLLGTQGSGVAWLELDDEGDK
jgi:hypothetical protein